MVRIVGSRVHPFGRTIAPPMEFQDCYATQTFRLRGQGMPTLGETPEKGDFPVNSAGVEVVLRLLGEIEALQDELARRRQG